LNDAFKDLRGAGVIPDTLRINHGHRAARTDLETIRFGPSHAGLGAYQAEFLESPFEILPGFQAGAGITALGFAGIGAQEDVAPQGGNAKGGTDCGEIRGGRRVMAHATSPSLREEA
jgi:hypothetical protein